MGKASIVVVSNVYHRREDEETSHVEGRWSLPVGDGTASAVEMPLVLAEGRTPLHLAALLEATGFAGSTGSPDVAVGLLVVSNVSRTDWQVVPTEEQLREAAAGRVVEVLADGTPLLEVPPGAQVVLRPCAPGGVERLSLCCRRGKADVSLSVFPR